MAGHGRKLLGIAAALVLVAGGSMGWAGERAPAVSNLTLEPVWGGVYQLTARVQARSGIVTAAQYRVGAETGPLFAADGLMDSPVEAVQTYIDLPPGGGPVEVRARAGGAWSEWHRLEGPGGQTGGEAPCELFADLPEDEGPRRWFRGPVVIDCLSLMWAEEADWVDFTLLSDVEWTAVEDAFAILEEEGVHWVQVRAGRADGTAGRPHTFPVRIDGTPPEVRMEPVPAVMGHADRLALRFDAVDDRSGVAMLHAEIDGGLQVEPGQTVELWRLSPGLHEIVVRAVDQAGNETALEPVQVMVITSPGEMAKLVQLFAARGKVDTLFGFKQELLSHLQATEEALAMGDLTAAQSHLEQFAVRVETGVEEGLIFEDAAAVLLDDVAWLFAWAEENLGL